MKQMNHVTITPHEYTKKNALQWPKSTTAGYLKTEYKKWTKPGVFLYPQEKEKI